MGETQRRTTTNLGRGPHAASRFVDNDGVIIHYLDLMPDEPTELSAHPLVFSLGMTDIALDYLEVVQHTGRRTIVIDPRGQGLSDAPATGYSLDHRAGDIGAVIADAVDGELHLMTFSRGSCYAMWWAANNPGRVRSLSVGDYPGREISLTGAVGDSMLATTWRGTPVPDRVARHAMQRTFIEAGQRPLWDEVAALAVPTVVVRSTAEAPITDDDWDRYEQMEGVERVFFADSPHDIFRPDRTRFPKLVAKNAAAGDAVAQQSIEWRA